MKIVVMSGEGEGCDYTIGCNLRIDYIDDHIDNEKYLDELIDSYSAESLEHVTIATIKDKCVYNIDEYLESKAPVRKRIADAEEKVDAAERSVTKMMDDMRKTLEEGGVSVPPDADLSDPTVMNNLMFALGKKNKENE